MSPPLRIIGLVTLLVHINFHTAAQDLNTQLNAATSVNNNPASDFGPAAAAAAASYFGSDDEELCPYIAPPTDFPADQWGNRIPDFSQVGYRRGHVPLPNVPVAKILLPSTDPRINDRERIQSAIDWVGRQPLRSQTLRDGTVIKTRGTVLLRAGFYRVQGSLILNRSGVVLRGEGNGPSGTIVMATGQFKHDFIHLNGLLDSSFQGLPEYQAKHGGSKLKNTNNPFIILDKTATPVADEYIPVGTTRLPVKDISNFEVGAEIIVERKGKEAWIQRLTMDHIPPRPLSAGTQPTVSWDPRQFELTYVRKIKAIEMRPRATDTLAQVDAAEDALRDRRRQRHGSPHRKSHSDHPAGPLSNLRMTIDTNLTGRAQPIDITVYSPKTRVGDDDDEDDDENWVGRDDPRWVPGYLTLDIPLVMNMDPVYGSGVVYNFERETSIPTDVGVENMALLSDYDESNVQDESHGWYAVLIDHCQNCWAADLKTQHFVSGIKSAIGSKHVTIQDCVVTDPISLPEAGGRRYMFMLQGQMGLVKRCFSSDARHDFITGSRTSGPNVFVDSAGLRANNDAGPHDRWTTGTLYDNIHSSTINVRNRGWMGSGQGWAGAFQVLYRCSADTKAEFQSPPGATNWIIGFNGTIGHQVVDFEGSDATVIGIEPQDEPRMPRSLYWSQLVARMRGKDAMAIEALVGASGKNQYAQSSLPRRFTTPAEIKMEHEEIWSDMAMVQAKNMRLELELGSELRDHHAMEREIQRLERELVVDDL
ncbi:hypothetical protein BGZ75_005414 [Mortierella antarctica]|nr:hypothetical protein BGZ75_005414 [Mortierella antarctica]